MQLPRFKFSPISLAELIAILIFLPLAISIWSSGIEKMKYTINFRYAVTNYSVNEIFKTEKGIAKAQKAQETIPLFAFKAMYFAENQKYDQAIADYRQMLDFSDEPWIAKLGIAVCELYKNEKNRENNKEFLIALDKLATQVRKIESNKSDFSDASILLGQIYLQQAISYRQSKKMEPYKRALTKAGNQFAKAENPRSKSNWIPPSRSACISLYLGLAYVNYYRAQNILEQLPQPALPSITTGKVTLLHKHAIRYFKKAFTYRRYQPHLLNNLCALYGNVMCFSWLRPEERRQLIQESKQFIGNLNSFASHLSWMGEHKQLEKWQLTTQQRPMLLAPIRYAQGISHFYIARNKNIRMLDAIVSLSGAMPRTPKSQRHKVYNALLQTKIHNVDISRLQRIQKQGEHYSKASYRVRDRGLYKNCEQRYKKAYAKLKRTRKPTIKIFMEFNHYLFFLYLKKDQKVLKKICKVMRKMAKTLPAEKFYLGVKEDPVTVQQVIYHNLYMVYRRWGKKFENNAKALADKQLHPTER